MNHGTYIGPEEELKGKDALLQTRGDVVLAQFDDIETGLGFGWHEFLITCWVIDDNPFELEEA